MSAVKQKDTKPEIILRRALWEKGYRYRKNYKKLPGKPDIVFVGKRVAVFCDGDYWHGHNWVIRGYGSLEEELSRYSDFWRKKIEGNIERDQKNNALLKEMGWTVIRLWESDIRKNLDTCIIEIAEALASK
jgi:DNA mismatch endonuclease (patch repair protein)